jgi:selenocysteine lyase/cysteine desulfurase
MRPEDRVAREALRAEYRAFLRPGRVLLTGHSHQAWPDAVRPAMSQAFDDAAEYVDDKWERAVFPRVERVGARVLDRLGFDRADPIAFGRSSHELGFRLLSCFGPAPRVVTTTGEFHSMRRQLRRLEEAGASVTWVERDPLDSLAERLVAEIRRGADLVTFSTTFFEDSAIFGDAAPVIEEATRRGVHVLCDAYHGYGVLELAWPASRELLFVTAGGYKYAQFGEGICFMRAPPESSLRPVYTGWFADFGSLADPGARGPVGYGGGGDRWSGATFDPVAFYRAEAALDVLDRHGLTPSALRAISVAQTTRIVEGLAAAGVAIASPREAARRAGFVAARVPGAGDVVKALRGDGVFVDSRGDLLRLGPAPYLTDEELDHGLARVVARVHGR